MAIEYTKFYQKIYEKALPDIPKEKRTFKNLPRYATGKPKVKFQEWLGLKGNGSKGYDGRYYGWSHRAINSYGVNDKISGDDIGHVNYSFDDNNNDNQSYIIKTEDEAKKHAIRYGKNVS